MTDDLLIDFGEGLDFEEDFEPMRAAVRLHTLYEKAREHVDEPNAILITGHVFQMIASFRRARFDKTESPAEYLAWIKLVHNQMKLLGVPAPDTDWSTLEELARGAN